jgi:hypothetical protein
MPDNVLDYVVIEEIHARRLPPAALERLRVPAFAGAEARDPALASRPTRESFREVLANRHAIATRPPLAAYAPRAALAAGR